MKTGIRSRKGMTLVELVFAVLLTAVIGISIASFTSTLFKTDAGVEADAAPATQANLALAAVYERVLRAPTMVAGQSVYFQILDNGRTVTFMNDRGTGTENVSLVGDRLIYHTAHNEEQVLAAQIQDVNFYPIPCAGVSDCRLGMQITFSNGRGTLMSSVFPRNKNSTKSWIN